MVIAFFIISKDKKGNSTMKGLEHTGLGALPLHNHSTLWHEARGHVKVQAI